MENDEKFKELILDGENLLIFQMNEKKIFLLLITNLIIYADI
jgi:hypothetical protein